MKFFSIMITLAILLIIPAVYAQVQYPVQELGNCASQQDCEKYCDDIRNSESCIDFAEKVGMMKKDEVAEARKMIPYLKAGETPGKCNSEKVCDDFCNKDENLQECIAFAEKSGLISGEELAMVKKTGGKGPGGCKSEEECNAFCKNPDNQETCMNFGIEQGLIPPEDLEKMKKNQEFMDSDTGKCYSQCMKDAGISFKDCPEGGGGPENCKACQDKCFLHDQTSGGKCLSQEKWQQLNQDCQAKGSGYHLEEIKGNDGQGGECVVDETCVYGSGKEWESQAEKDRQLTEMQKQWDEERAKYEAEHGPGSFSEGGTGGGSGGGCTQPGPEGQCNPGPGAGPGPGGEGSGSSGAISGGSGEGGTGGEGNSGSGEGSSSGGSSGGDSGSNGGDSEGGQVVGVGAVIMKVNSNGIIKRLTEGIINLF